jgi:hypothetical protein
MSWGALPNKRLKLTAPSFGKNCVCAAVCFVVAQLSPRPPVFAPQLKRDPLGAASVDRDHPTRVTDRSRGRDAKAHHVEHGHH